jgi:hypothetical protein
MAPDALSSFLLTPEGHRQAFSDSPSLGGVSTSKWRQLAQGSLQQERPQVGDGAPFDLRPLLEGSGETKRNDELDTSALSHA